MNRKNLILNIILIFLIILSFFQASILWIYFPSINDSKENKNQYDSNDLIKEVLKPRKLIINFSDGSHTLLHSFDDIYREYSNFLANVFLNSNSEKLSPITPEEYIKLTKEKSLIFKFNNNLDSNIYSSLIGYNKNKNTDTNLIQEIYIGLDKIAVRNDKGHFILNIKENIPDIQVTLNSLRERGYSEFITFSEKYGINKNILIPKNNIFISKDSTYSTGIESLDPKLKTNLVERLLEMNIDNVKEITQADGTTYAYGNRFVRLLNSGLIEYENSENFSVPKRNLFISLNTSMSFISSKIGYVNDINIASIKEIKNGNNVGYKISFNLNEDSIGVYPLSNDRINYIEIDVYSNYIKNYKEIYRKDILFPPSEYKKNYIKSLDSIIEENLNIFLPIIKEDSKKIILENIDDINVAYVDNISSFNSNKLILAIKIDFNNRQLFFSLKNGKFLMER